MSVFMIWLIVRFLWSLSAYAPCNTLERRAVSGCSISLVSLGVIIAIIASLRRPGIADLMGNTGGVGVSPEPLGRGLGGS